MRFQATVHRIQLVQPHLELVIHDDGQVVVSLVLPTPSPTGADDALSQSR
jgi:hypothetical protein